MTRFTAAAAAATALGDLKQTAMTNAAPAIRSRLFRTPQPGDIGEGGAGGGRLLTPEQKLVPRIGGGYNSRKATTAEAASAKKNTACRRM